MYLVSEYIVCVLLVFVVVTLPVAAFTAAINLREGIVILSGAAFSTVNGLEQRVRRVVAPAVREADTMVNTLQRQAPILQTPSRQELDERGICPSGERLKNNSRSDD